MPTAKPQRPVARARQVAPVSDDFTQRQIVQAAQRSADQVRDRSRITVDLAVGPNVINHKLGRKPAGATVTPSVADAVWAWAFSSPTTTQMTITCVGVAQPGALVEAF